MTVIFKQNTIKKFKNRYHTFDSQPRQQYPDNAVLFSVNIAALMAQYFLLYLSPMNNMYEKTSKTLLAFSHIPLIPHHC
jgi:hypothetical protein